ncbi:hypothetical protein [Bacillus safensis]|uniref:hypothetical protein n=1 Tax=Bacillus safensis TaxID=561879 RepID=UPI002280F47A|nr:hypothetical protein [Bacillus safensis]MCY7675722.1 hypothetical protein [Bacillus safensis]MCY7699785.1 hypothetical protein [Bacillus safensis]MEC3628324.1 hypothetical protein [Bacillus safensis]
MVLGDKLRAASIAEVAFFYGGMALDLLKDCSKQRTTTLIVDINTRHSRAIWQGLKKKFPQYKYPQFVSRNSAMLDGVNPSETILILLPGYSRNPIINCYEFQWLKENALDVIHINEEEIK